MMINLHKIFASCS